MSPADGVQSAFRTAVVRSGIASASVVFDAGARLLAHTGSEEALILVDWRPDTGRVLHSAISVSRV